MTLIAGDKNALINGKIQNIIIANKKSHKQKDAFPKECIFFIFSNLTPSNRFRAECNRFRARGK